MQGFINKDYMIRHLNNPDDIYAIIDDVISVLNLTQIKHQVIHAETAKLVRKYNDFLTNRRIESTENKPSNNIDFATISTDDEK